MGESLDADPEAGQLPRLSIVSPVLNMERYLEPFLAAVLAQDYPQHGYEIILVDNGSTDRGSEIIDQHKRVRLLHESSRGSYAARNRGVREARGEIIAFIDPDCIPAPGWLKAIEGALAVPGREIVLGARLYRNSSRLLQRLSDYELSVAEFVFSHSSGKIYFGYTNNMAVRRSLFERTGYFHEIPRGADTVLVQSTVAMFGTESVGHDGNISVCHLEIRGISDFYRKRRIYRKSNSRTVNLGTARPLGARQRVQLFLRTCATLTIPSLPRWNCWGCSSWV